MNLFIHRAITCQILLIETFVTIYLFILIFYLSQVEPEPLPRIWLRLWFHSRKACSSWFRGLHGIHYSSSRLSMKISLSGVLYTVQVDQDLNIGNVGQFFKFVMAFLLFIFIIMEDVAVSYIPPSGSCCSDDICLGLGKSINFPHRTKKEKREIS